MGDLHGICQTPLDWELPRTHGISLMNGCEQCLSCMQKRKLRKKDSEDVGVDVAALEAEAAALDPAKDRGSRTQRNSAEMQSRRLLLLQRRAGEKKGVPCLLQIGSKGISELSLLMKAACHFCMHCTGRNTANKFLIDSFLRSCMIRIKV